MAQVTRLIDQVTGMVAGGPQAWRRLGHARRKDVLHLARQGRRYPDPAVWAVAVDWAHWWLAAPLWRRLLRATGIALGIYVAVGVGFFAVLPFLLLIPGGSFEVQRGYWWIVRDGSLLGLLVFVLGVLPSVDARHIDRLSRPPSAPDEA
jgi:hypothetical protein